ncbi:MAG: flagellar export chaperone FliS [Deltaproteobacteria bacterium]|nr:flagellar export chaperone FliS [Deltaproteobacteria bacterium]
MTYKRMLGQYNKLNVETAGRLDLVLMCYEKAIESLWQARKSYEQGQYEQKARKLQRGLRIIQELQGCLNFEKGGQIARNLDAIYTYLVRRLLEGDVKRDLTAFDEAVKILTDLKDSWRGIASENQAKEAIPGYDAQSETHLQQVAA